MSEGMEIQDRRGWHFTQVENIFLDDTESYDIYEKMVYVVICRFANVNSKAAFPSNSTIASMAACSERKARETLSSLEQKNVIEIKRRTGATSLITLLPITPAQHAPRHDMPGTPAQHATPPRHDMPGGAAHCATELERTELERTNERNLTTGSSNARARDTHAGHAIEFYENSFGGTLTDRITDFIYTWTDHLSAEVVIEALRITRDNFAKNPPRYAEAILKEWDKYKLTTAEEVQKYQAHKEEQKEANNGRNEKGHTGSARGAQKKGAAGQRESALGTGWHGNNQ